MSKRACSAVTVCLNPSAGNKTQDVLFFPSRLQGLIIKEFIKAIESPVENTRLPPTWMELTSFALATECPP